MQSSEGRLSITFPLSGGNMTSIFTFMGLPKSGCCSCGSTDDLSDACSLSPFKSWDAPTHLPVDKLTYIQEALCRWANSKSATLYELQSLNGTRQFAYKIYCPRRVLSITGRTFSKNWNGESLSLDTQAINLTFSL